MPQFEYKSITGAFKDALTGQHAFNAAQRNDAAQEVRRVTKDRVYQGRRPGEKRPWVSVQQIGEDRTHNAEDGVSDNTPVFVEVSCYSQEPEERARLTAAVGFALDWFRGTIGGVEIGACQLQDPSELDPEKMPDASDTWEFESNLIFRVTYCRTRAGSIS